MLEFFKSVLDEDKAPVVICDLDHKIIYMNPVSIERYHKNLVGKSILDCHPAKANEMIERVVEWFKASEKNNRIYTYRNDEENKDVYMIALRDEEKKLIGYYEKHEYRGKETAKLYDFKAD